MTDDREYCDDFDDWEYTDDDYLDEIADIEANPLTKEEREAWGQWEEDFYRRLEAAQEY